MFMHLWVPEPSIGYWNAVTITDLGASKALERTPIGKGCFHIYHVKISVTVNHHYSLDHLSMSALLQNSAIVGRTRYLLEGLLERVHKF